MNSVLLAEFNYENLGFFSKGVPADLKFQDIAEGNKSQRQPVSKPYRALNINHYLELNSHMSWKPKKVV